MKNIEIGRPNKTANTNTKISLSTMLTATD